MLLKLTLNQWDAKCELINVAQNRSASDGVFEQDNQNTVCIKHRIFFGRRNKTFEEGLCTTGAVGRKGGHEVAQLVEALLYKPEGHGLYSRWCHWIFTLK
jgi:hypothetical protein